MKKQITALLLAAAMLVSMNCAWAESENKDYFSKSDLNDQPDLSGAVSINLSAEDSSSVTIEEAGTYIVSGSLTGQLVVACSNNDKVTIVLNGVEITSPDSAAIAVLSADKVFLNLAEGTENTLMNGGSYAEDTEYAIDAALWSKSDLTINGTGSLTVMAQAGNGIVSKDDLIITGGTLMVGSSENGIEGKDSVSITSSDITVSAGKDGICTKNSKDEGKGSVYAESGNIIIAAGDDGIDAKRDVVIQDATLTITAGGGSGSGTMKASDNFMGGGRWGNFNYSEAESEGSNSCGITCSGSVTVENGEIVIDAASDAVHTGANITINGGTWSVLSADDAFTAETELTISGGDITISYCYEGLEAQFITVSGGSIDITSNDDGLNAVDNTSASDGWGTASTNAAITISGGTITVVAGGDCMDSNGTLIISGGTLNLTCNSSMNTAIDYETDYSWTGGEISTNDGSESGSGMMGGMNGGMGGFNGAMPSGMNGGFPGGGGRR